MYSFTTSVALLQKMAKIETSDTTNTALITQFWNDSIRTICSMRGGTWWFLETTKDINTVASQATYAVPANMRKVVSVYITVGSGSTAVKYVPAPVYDDNTWNLILASRLAASDVPLFYRITGSDKIEIQPVPATNDNVITVRGRLNVKDLSVADYTTGTITSIANGGVAVVGSGSTWTSAMVDRFIKFGTDNLWYKILAAPTATTITLFAPYEGITLSAATSAYTIGQMSPIPEAYEMAPVFRALALYAQVNDPIHPGVAKMWWNLYDGGNEAGYNREIGGQIGQMLSSEGGTVEGSFLPPNPVTWPIDPNYPPKDATGF